MYDIPSGQHFITFKYMVAWKDAGEGENDALTVSFGYTQGAVQEHYLSTQQFVKDEVDNKVSSIYKYKGSVANKEALPTENLTIGDVYNLEDTGMNVAYTGEK